MANTHCDLCGRKYWDGALSGRTIPLAADGDYCEACAVAACAAIDWMMVQATRVTPGWVSIPEVEWDSVIIADWLCAFSGA